VDGAVSLTEHGPHASFFASASGKIDTVFLPSIQTLTVKTLFLVGSPAVNLALCAIGPDFYMAEKNQQ
jgi:hypothetical protein